MSADSVLHSTSLLEEHKALGAKIVPFAGWNMPVSYEGILAEYEANRRGVSILDCSHMGEFVIEGDYAKSGFDRIVTLNLATLPLKTCRYGAMLTEQGTIIDDLIVYRIAEEKWMIVVNASNIDKDAKHFKAHLTSGASFRDISFQTGKLDVQGPLSREALKPLISGVEKLEYYAFDEFSVLGERVIVSRTGYTGELGYEIYYPWQKTPELWKEILKNDRVKPCGLGVRDVLRTEMCYSLYGHELDETITPLEAGLEKFIDFNKEFIGRDALLKEKADGVKRKMIYFVSENRRSPRNGHHIFSTDGRKVGFATSGTFSPTLERGIGIGLVETSYGKVGDKMLFGDDRSNAPADIVKRPFYKSGSLKN